MYHFAPEMCNTCADIHMTYTVGSRTSNPITIQTWLLLCLQRPGLYMPSFGPFNTLRPRQNCHHFADDIFKWIFVNENVCILLKISLKFVPRMWINNIRALVEIMAWRRPGDKPLSAPMMVGFSTHICVTRPQWVNCHGLALVPAWISDHMPRKVWDKIAYPFLAFNGCTVGA